MIFSVMGIREKNQPKMLKLGILLSIFLRIAFILFGVELIHRFHFVIYLFGVLLLYTAYKMEFMGDEEIEPKNNLLYKLASRIFPIETDPEAEHFFVKKNGVRYATTLFLIFLLIGSTDIVFAFDSIPAILGITQDPFIVISSNVFAVLGLISLFFALKGIMGMFRFLKRGVAFILLFVGVKMIISAWVIISIQMSLFVIIGTLLVSIVASIVIKEAIDQEVTEEDAIKLKKSVEKLSSEIE
jgi:tellurite resistance protein TerC